MPDAIANTGVNTGSGEGSGSGLGSGTADVKITQGGGTLQVGGVVEPKANQQAGGEKKIETFDPFSFKFDGDDAEYVEKPESKPDEGGDKSTYDASKPLDNNIKEALKAKPELLKQVEKNHYELRQWQKSGFKTPAEVTAFTKGINDLATSLGRADGLKGVEAIKAEAQEWATVMAGLSAGDPAVIDQMFDDNTEGLTKLAGPYLTKLATSAPAAFQYEISKIMMATLNASDTTGLNVIAAYNQLAAKYGDDPDAAKLLNRLHSVFDAIYKTAQKAPETAAQTNPQLEARQKALDDRETGMYHNTIANKGKSIVDSAIEQGLSKAFAKGKLSDDAKDELRANVLRALQAAQGADDVYKKNAWDCLNSKDDDGFLKTIKASIVRHLPGILRKQSRLFTGIGGERKAEGQSHVETGAGAQTGTTQAVKYSGQLEQGAIPPKLIDYPLMRQIYGRAKSSDMLFNRQALLKGKGRTIYSW